jgi:hypothetical protein
MRFSRNDLYAFLLFVFIVLLVIGAGATPRTLIYQGF